MLGALAVVLSGRLLGLVQLYVVGTTGLVLVAAAVAWVRLTPVRIHGTRGLRPQRVPVGGSVEIECCLTNASARRSPPLGAHDPLRPGARLLVGRLAPGGSGRVGYQLRAERRGVIEAGPLEVELRDPFGLAASTSLVAGGTTLTVLPHLEVLAPPPLALRGAGAGGPARPPISGPSRGSFYALREYAPGDDLRRVHWASTARRDRLMIRQDDHPVQRRATVALDLGTGDEEAFESAVSAAASLLSAAGRPDGAGATLVRLVDTAGHDSRYGCTSAHVAGLLDRLAAATPLGSRPGSRWFDQVAAILRNSPGDGTAVVVTYTDASTDQLERLASLAPRYSPILVVAIGEGRVRAGAVPVIAVRPGQDLAPVWNRVVCAANRPRVGHHAGRARP